MEVIFHKTHERLSKRFCVTFTYVLKKAIQCYPTMTVSCFETVHLNLIISLLRGKDWATFFNLMQNFCKRKLTKFKLPDFF